MQNVFANWQESLSLGILLVLIAILVVGLRMFRERGPTGTSPKDRWRCWARRTVAIQVIFFLFYPAFISDGFIVAAVPVCLVPIGWGFYTDFCYHTKGEHYVGLVGGVLSIYWIYFAWDSNIAFLFMRR